MKQPKQKVKVWGQVKRRVMNPAWDQVWDPVRNQVWYPD
jgi:hypothetical protein